MLLQSATLGYAPSQKFARGSDEDFIMRQTNAALLMIDVAVDRFDATTGVAPVEAVSEPLLQGLALDQDSRAIPLGWAYPLFVTASDPSPRRFLMSPAPGEPLAPASPRTNTGALIDQCRYFLQTCARRSSRAPCGSHPPTPEPLASSRSGPGPGRTGGTRGRPRRRGARHRRTPRGFMCPLALGSVNISVTAMGQRITSPVRVVAAPRLGGP